MKLLNIFEDKCCSVNTRSGYLLNKRAIDKTTCVGSKHSCEQCPFFYYRPWVNLVKFFKKRIIILRMCSIDRPYELVAWLCELKLTFLRRSNKEHGLILGKTNKMLFSVPVCKNVNVLNRPSN